MKFLFIIVFFSNTIMASDELTQVRQQELRHMLKHDCGSCHGLTRKGGLGPALLADNLMHKSSEFLVQTIREGREGTAMPPWKPFITKKEALWMVDVLLIKR